MKNSIKKYLILLAVVTVVMLTFAFSASAASFTPQCSNSDCNGNTLYYIDLDDTSGLTFVEPGCETVGFTRVKCTKCKNFMSGYINEKAPTGHDYKDEYQLDADHYERVEVCANCSHVKHPEPNTKYYKVTFYNPFATNGKGYYVSDCPYTNLVDFEKDGYNAYATKKLAEIYVKDGEVAAYQGMCVREADKIFSNYTLVGWASKTAIVGANGEIDKTIIDTRIACQVDPSTNKYLNPEAFEKVFGTAALKHDPEAEAIAEDDVVPPIYINNNKDENNNNIDTKSFKVPLENDVKADYDVYAIFVGNKETHTVTFMNPYGAMPKEVPVVHGMSASYNGLNAPVKPDNYQLTYIFTGNWTTSYEKGGDVIDLNNIYDSITVYPDFDVHSKTYLLKYYDKYGNEIKDANDEPITDTVAIAGPEREDYQPVNGRALDIKTYFDNAYLYTYTGLWEFKDRLGAAGMPLVNIYDVTFPPSVLNYEETNGYIALKPYYTATPRYYSLPIEITYPSDGNAHPYDLDLQIVSADGSTTRQIKLDADDVEVDKYGVEKYSTIVQGLKYSENYRVTATTRTYHGAADRVIFLTGDRDKMEDDKYSSVKITLEHLKQKDCNCICHTVFRPIWVAVLNMLHTLFRVKHVCCDDMFANIGDQLNYDL